MKPVAAHVSHHQQPWISSAHNHVRHPLFSKPISFLFVKTPALPSLSCLSIQASSVPSPSVHSSNPEPQIPETLDSNNLSSPPSNLKSAAISAITFTALLFTGFHLSRRPMCPPVTYVSSLQRPRPYDTERQEILGVLESHILENPDDIQALKGLLKIRLKDRELEEAIRILDELNEIQPNQTEWLLLKSQLQVKNEERFKAKLGFNQILSKDPFCVKAYHGLITAAPQDGSSRELREVEKRIVEAMELCEEKKKREFKLLLAAIRVVERRFKEALKMYEEFEKEWPEDFRPYLYQGIIYTWMQEGDEADKNFAKYKELLPARHPLARLEELSA